MAAKSAYYPTVSPKICLGVNYMNYNLVKFQGAYGTSAQIPESVRPEVSFVGRSNVGKSSLINRLFNRKKLAKVSSRKNIDDQLLYHR